MKINNNVITHFRVFLTISFLLLTLSACGGSDSSTENSSEESAETTASSDDADSGVSSVDGATEETATVPSSLSCTRVNPSSNFIIFDEDAQIRATFSLNEEINTTGTVTVSCTNGISQSDTFNIVGGVVSVSQVAPAACLNETISITLNNIPENRSLNASCEWSVSSRL